MDLAETTNVGACLRHRALVPRDLPDRSLISQTQLHEQDMRTFHHNIHFIGQIRDNIQGLGNSYLRFLPCESVEALEGRFYFIISQEFLYIFLCYIQAIAVNQREKTH